MSDSDIPHYGFLFQVAEGLGDTMEYFAILLHWAEDTPQDHAIILDLFKLIKECLEAVLVINNRSQNVFAMLNRSSPNKYNFVGVLEGGDAPGVRAVIERYRL